MSTDSRRLAEIQRDLYAGVPVPDLLRKCLALGQQAGADELVTWARQELNGYDHEPDVPDYRRVPADVYADVSTAFLPPRREKLEANRFPEHARATVRRPVAVMHSISQIQALLEPPVPPAHRLQLPQWDTLAGQLQAANPGLRITSIYWLLPSTAVAAVVDRVRTRLAELVGGLVATAGGIEHDPTPAQTAQVTQTMLAQPGAHVSVNTAMGASTASSTTAVPHDRTRRGRRSDTRSVRSSSGAR